MHSGIIDGALQQHSVSRLLWRDVYKTFHVRHLRSPVSNAWRFGIGFVQQVVCPISHGSPDGGTLSRSISRS